MALMQTGTLGNGSPKMYYELYADNIGASGNNKTVRITVKVKVNGSSSSKFGYAVNWRANIQTPYEFAVGGWQTLKGSEFWYGSDGLRTYSQDITFNGKTASSIACLPGFEISSSSSSWNGLARTSTNFSTASSNTPPYWSNGSVKVYKDSSKTTEYTGIIPENTSSVFITWSGGKDNEGGTLKYGVNKIVNGGSPTTISYPNTGSSYTDNISGISEGGTVRYYVDIRDNHDALSSAIYTNTLTKNKLTPATLTSSSSINYDTSSIAFSYSGENNTNGNTSFTYSLTCSEITVYNPTVLKGSATITIYKSGTVPSNAYIKFDDIKKKFSSSSFKGTLNFVLTTTNAYGTSKTSTKAINVDLRTAPNNVNCSVSSDKTLSTCIKTTADTSNNYFIPNGSDVIRITWSGGSCKLGSTVTYQVQAKFGNGAFTTIASNLSASTTYYNYKCPKQTTSQSIVFRVISTTSFGYTATKDSSAVTLHYYNNPNITIGTITRADTSATVNVTVKTNSSIPNINTKGSWKMSSTNQTGNLTQSQGQQTINTTGLTSNGTYTLTITYNDGTGFSSNATHQVSIGANLPVFEVNKYGIGVGGYKANERDALNVKGRSWGTAFISEGYPITNPSNTYVNKWCKIATMKVTGQYGDACFRAEFIDYGSGTGSPTTGHIIARLKQQNPMGQAPYYGFYISDYIRINPNDLKMIITSNTTSLTEAQIWYKASLSHTVVHFSPTMIKNSVEFFKQQPYQDNPPSGTAMSPCKIVNFDANDVGALPTTGGTLTGNITINASNKNFQIGAGASDVYLYNGNANKYLQFRDDGKLAIGGNIIADPSLPLLGTNGKWHSFIPAVDNNGVMEVGAMIDFHASKTGTTDYDVRLLAGTDKTLTLTGNLAVSGSFTTGGYGVLHQGGGITSLQQAGSGDGYMHVSTKSMGAKGISWWNSDIKFKENIQEIVDSDAVPCRSNYITDSYLKASETMGIDVINQIKHYTFDYIPSEGGKHIECGYVSQQLEEVNDKFVIKVEQDEDSPYYDEEDKYIRQPNPTIIIPYLSKAIQELDMENKKLRSELEEIKSHLGLI